MKRQIKPIKAARTGAPPFKNAITSAPQASGPIGKTAKTVKAIKTKPRIIETIFFTPILKHNQKSNTLQEKSTFFTFFSEKLPKIAYQGNIICGGNFMANEIMIHNEDDLRLKIYTIRGLQVMLDFDLAETYGYETKMFNRQVKNNIERFDEDFRFQLTQAEFEAIKLRCNFCTSSSDKKNLDSKEWGGKRYLPYAFTEQGIYMLMTVLRGDLAVKQSKALIRIFKQMKDFIIQSQNVLATPELLKLSLQTTENTRDIQGIKKTITEHMVTKDDLSKVMKNFTDPNIKRDYLFFNGETVEADIAYSTIYSSAKKTIYVVDNYIGLKTLVLLKSVKSNVQVTIFSDNVGKGLHQTEFSDFQKEYPNVHIDLKTTNGIYHDRYIFVDYGTKTEKVYHCGGSSKDGGTKTMSISQVEDTKVYQMIVADLLKNPSLVL